MLVGGPELMAEQEWAFTIKSVGRGSDKAGAWADMVATLRDELYKMGPDNDIANGRIP